MHQLGLHAGEWVVVRSKEEILATLDANGELDNMPFQPEMFAYCGQRLRVFKSAHKTCDTVNKTGGRSLQNTVHLDNVRCNGAAHGGCEAACLIFWKEAWLRREHDAPRAVNAAHSGDDARVQNAVRAPARTEQQPTRWRCQATELPRFTKLLPWWDARQYVRDVVSGNVGLWDMSKRFMLSAYRSIVGFGVGFRALIALYNAFQKLRNGRRFPFAEGVLPEGSVTPVATLNLQPGEWVQVKSQDEIRATITRNGYNRGMRFDVEMTNFCDGRYRVLTNVKRLINEQTGEMMEMKSPCIILEDVVCESKCSDRRLGCPRAIYPYWREIWLKRV